MGYLVEKLTNSPKKLGWGSMWRCRRGRSKAGGGGGDSRGVSTLLCVHLARCGSSFPLQLDPGVKSSAHPQWSALRVNQDLDS